MAKKKHLPAMPFYVGDWLKAQDIQTLPYDIRGLWFEMLCYMWESVERGYLVDNKGRSYSKNELAFLLRLGEGLLEQKLKVLEDKGIYSVRKSDSAIYCRRMVKDEEIRQIRAKVGRAGGEATAANYFATPNLQAKPQQNNEIENETVHAPSLSIEDRRIKLLGRAKEFETTLKPFEQLYSKEMIKDFYEYWCEPNKTFTKMRFDFEKTWSLKRRLRTWSDRKNETTTKDASKTIPSPGKSNIE